MRRRIVALAFLCAALLGASPLRADCTGPAGVEGESIYNADYHVIQFCNGTHWISTASSGAVTPPAGTPGVVQFNSNGTLGGNTKLFWDNSLERLGVGTSAPAQTLDVTGTAGFSGAVTMGSTLAVTGNVGIGTTGPAYSLDVNGATRFKGIHIVTSTVADFGANLLTAIGGLVFNNGTKITQNDPVNYSMSFYSGSTPTQNMVIRETGNVGIGTTNPLTKLVASNGTDGIELAPGSTNILQAVSRPGGSYDDLSIKGRDIIFTANNVEAMRLQNSTGSVGIGTTVPSQMLSVGASNQFTVTSAGAVTAVSFSGSGAALTSLNASNLSSGTVGTARLGSGTADNTTYLRGDGTWASVASSQWSDGASSAIYYNSGNVGIGTASPTHKLRVDGGLVYLRPYSAIADQGLQVDTSVLANASNAIFVNMPGGWTGNIISANLNGVAKFTVGSTGTINAPGMTNATGTYPVCWSSGGGV